MDTTIARPKAVTIAVAAICISYLATVAGWVLTNGLPHFAIGYAIIVAFAFLYLGCDFGIYMRVRFVRWLFIAFYALSLLSVPIAIQNYRTGSELYSDLMKLALWTLAVVMLFVAPSRLWFKKA